MAKLRSQDAAARIENGLGPDFSEALARGLAVLTAFGTERGPLTLSDIARLVDLPRATTRRALYTLTHLGFAESDGKLYRLTPKVLTLAGSYLLSNQISTILQPACDALSAEFGEAVSAAVLLDDQVVMIAHASPQRLMAAGAGIGFRVPAYCSALGRVLLAALPDLALDRYFEVLMPVAVTAVTITDKAALRAAVLETRTRGYALVDQEAESGFRSLAVPIRRYDGRVIAAMNIGARVERSSVEDMVAAHLERLCAVSDEICRQLI
ncbi:transcriptional regulator [Aliidongia dinghuensis]|uniref:Transcriptional regulator n=1 Tax=Aliidongia dinghuensis TaxID=1867774 RepID=A0A8J2Z1J1_9PROT|nr:IclR family transcriptional regulator C-terminal domain-containing protein [Aliidongia dinghuensis]GGF45248.1 transcriptional regulator [Aliidongia dinghuensis]